MKKRDGSWNEVLFCVRCKGEPLHAIGKAQRLDTQVLSCGVCSTLYRGYVDAQDIVKITAIYVQPSRKDKT